MKTAVRCGGALIGPDAFMSPVKSIAALWPVRNPLCGLYVMCQLLGRHR